MARQIWCATLLVLGALPQPGGAQAVMNAAIEITPERDSATVGDSVQLHVRVRLDDRDLLLDSVPRLAGGVPAGVQVLAADRVVRQPDRTFAGRIVVAFYRTGRRAVPPFELTYRRNVTVLGATVRSDPVPMEIVPVLPAGSGQPLKDIKDLAATPRSDLVRLGIAAAVFAVLLGVGIARYRHQHGRRRRTPPPTPASGPAASPDTLAVALGRLRAIEQEEWPTRGEVAHHYEAVVTVLRDYLVESAHVPAHVSTTTELLATLPAPLTPNGTREQLRDLLREADLVKFARVRPLPLNAGQFLDGVRELLNGWTTDAVR